MEAPCARRLTPARLYDRVIRMEEVLTVRVPKGTRRALEKHARARSLTVSQYVRQALDIEQFLDVFEAARRELVPQARSQGIYTDEDVFKIIS